MRTHGWAGNPPADDDEAIRRILDATRTCIDRDGPETGIVDVARELGVTRQTIYRYYRTTEDLLRAAAFDVTAAFLDRIERHLRRRGDSTPAEAAVEAIAYTLEQLPDEPYLGLLLTDERISIFTKGFTSPAALAVGRAMIERFPVDWSEYGFDAADLDELVEHMLRITQSFVMDSGPQPRTGRALRAYLDRWLAPVVVPRAAVERGSARAR
jgi:AcrR family transcriptional regulator